MSAESCRECGGYGYYLAPSVIETADNEHACPRCDGTGVKPLGES